MKILIPNMKPSMFDTSLLPKALVKAVIIASEPIAPNQNEDTIIKLCLNFHALITI